MTRGLELPSTEDLDMAIAFLKDARQRELAKDMPGALESLWLARRAVNRQIHVFLEAENRAKP